MLRAQNTALSAHILKKNNNEEFKLFKKIKILIS